VAAGAIASTVATPPPTLGTKTGVDKTTRSMPARPASQAGWHVSRYNIIAPIPDDRQDRYVVTNLYRGTCGAYPQLELAALAMLDRLPATHPAVERLIKRGLVVNFDERAAIETLARAACAHTMRINLTICPTMGCNFDCPYCFEDHTNVRMTPEVQDDVLALARRMCEASHAKEFTVTWFGGEPLLAPDVIASLSERLMTLAEEHGANYDAKIVTNGFLLTAEVAQMLQRSQVTEAQVTLDGMGATHDATRHLLGGGSSFGRIVENLSRPGLPFKVVVRHNVHEGNRGEIDELKAFVERIAAESGNDLTYYQALVIDTQTAERRGRQVDIVEGHAAANVLLSRFVKPTQVNPLHCGAGNIWDVGIDPQGRLHKCWEAVDKVELSFGNARTWDPADPLATAENPDLLTCYLNSSSPLRDEECRTCLWLPLCAGGCPYERLFGRGRACLVYKDDPETFALTLWQNMESKNGHWG